MPLKTNHLKPLARPLLLDAVPGAAAAYSLRQLSNAYTGPVVTVRRSSDDAEADFKASEIDDGTLTSFCGAGDGFVKTWWDQSVSGNHAIAPADANEPKIVDAGSLVTEGGKAAIQFDGSDDHMATASAISFANVCAFVLYKHKDGGLNWKRVINAWDSGSNDGWFLAKYLNTNSIEFRIEPLVGDGEITIPDASTTDDEHLLVTAIYAQGAGTVYKNGAIEDTKTGLTTSFAASQKITIGGRVIGSVVEAYALAVNEIIIYPSDQSANRQRIEGNIAWYY